MGSRLLAGRLAQSLEILEQAGISVPPSGRHKWALELMTRWNASDHPLDLTNPETRVHVEAANRIAWETFLITYQFSQRRKGDRTPFTREKLKTMLDGPAVKEGRNTEPRNIQFELYVAALLKLGGAEVQKGEPDLLLRYGYELTGVAAKRIKSLKLEQVRKHIKKASEQILRQKLRGWIAINIDSRFETILYEPDDGTVTSRFDGIFDAVTVAGANYLGAKHVLGIILFGQCTGWTQRDSDPNPTLVTASVRRWFALIDDDAEDQLFKDFIAGWEARLNSGIRNLASADFRGSL